MKKMMKNNIIIQTFDGSYIDISKHDYEQILMLEEMQRQVTNRED